MRIACPSCDAEYEVPAARLPPRRMVRCARCGNKWMAARDRVQPPAPAGTMPSEATSEATPEATSEIGRETVSEAPAVISPLPPLTAMDRLAAAPAVTRARPPGLLAAWVLTAFVLLAGAAATVTWRHAIVRAWPASARVLGWTDPALFGEAVAPGNAGQRPPASPPSAPPGSETK
jgi:predicted Zn finger-like uncharacterized protein